MNRLLEIWPSIREIADAIDTPYQTVAAWNRRGIPPKRFGDLIDAAAAIGQTLTYAELHDASQSQARGSAA